MSGPERQIQNAILRYLNIHGIFCWKVNNGAVWNASRNAYQANTTMKGVSDIIGLIPGDGRLIAVEVKSKKGRVSPAQKQFLETIKINGGIAGVARCVEDAKKLIDDACPGGTDDAIA